jgi:hypothetical protein
LAIRLPGRATPAEVIEIDREANFAECCMFEGQHVAATAPPSKSATHAFRFIPALSAKNLESSVHKPLV